MAKNKDATDTSAAAPIEPAKGEEPKRFTIRKDDKSEPFYSNEPLRAKHFKDLGYTVLDANNGNQPYDETNPAAKKA